MTYNIKYFIFKNIKRTLESRYLERHLLKSFKRMILITTGIIYLVSLLNLGGLLPYWEGLTSDLRFTFFLTTLVMLGITKEGIRESILKFFKGFIPSGVPGILKGFLMMIEIISYLSRVLSLAIRLTGNMIAGHLMISTCGDLGGGLKGEGMKKLFIIIPILSVTVLVQLEIFICLIQGYIFGLMVSLYLEDIKYAFKTKRTA